MNANTKLRTAGKISGIVALALGGILALGAVAGCDRGRKINYYKTYETHPVYTYDYRPAPVVVSPAPRTVIVTPPPASRGRDDGFRRGKDDSFRRDDFRRGDKDDSRPHAGGGFWGNDGGRRPGGREPRASRR